jgi:hypothetical protein
MSIERDCLIWQLWVKRGAVEVALESIAIKSKEGSTAMGFSKEIGSEGGGVEDEDSGVSTKRVLAVDGFCRTQQSTVLWKEDLWNVHHLADLGEEGDFGEEGAEAELG